MRFFVFIFSLFLALALAPPYCFAAANESPLPPSVPSNSSVFFGRAVFSNGSPVANLPIVLLARAGSSETIYRLISDSSGRFVVSLGQGGYELDALLADSSTSSISHAATAEADASQGENVTLVFYPAGSIAGTTQLDGAPVPGAKVRVACPSSGFDYSRVNGGATVQSGEAGDFLFRALPTGGCIISASTDSLAGSAEARVEHERTVSVAVEMKKKAATSDWLQLPAMLLAMAAVAYAAYRFMRKEKGRKPDAAQMGAEEIPAPEGAQAHPSGAAKKKKHGRDADKEEAPGIAGKLTDPKVKAVLSTLTDRESEIVRFIFKAGGRAKRSSIQNKLLIPKTSLLRNLRSLERKKIVKLTPFGRNLLAEIEGWLHK